MARWHVLQLNLRLVVALNELAAERLEVQCGLQRHAHAVEIRLDGLRLCKEGARSVTVGGEWETLCETNVDYINTASEREKVQ